MEQMQSYRHAEAYCLMTYRVDLYDGNESEVIWNSRDGVSPFMVRLRNGLIAKHVKWDTDVPVPDHKPAVGDRFFRDMTWEDAVALAHERVETYWEDPLYPAKEAYGSKENFEKVILTAYKEDVERGEPWLDTVTEEIARERGWL